MDTTLLANIVIPALTFIGGGALALVLQRREFLNGIQLKIFESNTATLVRLLEGSDLTRLSSQLEALSQVLTRSQIQEIRDKLLAIYGVVEQRFLNDITSKIFAAIASNTKFAARLAENQASKELIEKHLQALPFVRENIEDWKCIFVESGSTLAYAGLGLVRYRKELERERERPLPPLTICTNNIALYVLLLFEDNVETVLLPGKPLNQYGATFGLRGEAEKCAPDKVEQFLKDHNVEALFTTASLLDTRYGPHVSSEANHQLKRALRKYAEDPASPRPNMLVITAENVNGDFSSPDKNKTKKCHLLFSDKAPPYSPQDLEDARSEWLTHLGTRSLVHSIGGLDPHSVQSVSRELQKSLSGGRLKATDAVFGEGHLVTLTIGPVLNTPAPPSSPAASAPQVPPLPSAPGP